MFLCLFFYILEYLHKLDCQKWNYWIKENQYVFMALIYVAEFISQISS